MAFPPIKVVIAAAGGIGVGYFAGPKIAEKLVGPEIDSGGTSSSLGNNIKEYGALIGVGLATFVGLYMLLGA